MKKATKFIALFLIAALTVVGFAGCGAANDAASNPIVCISVVYGENGDAASGSDGAQSATPAGTPAATPSNSGNSTPAATTAAPAGNTPAAPAATPDAPANSDKPASDQPAASNGVPSTPEEVVNYYKEAYAKIASEGKSATLTWNNNQNAPAVLEVGALSSVAKTLMGMFLKESSPNTQLAPIDVAPKGVATCNLTPDMVSEATCKDNGSTYEIHIKLNATQDNPDVNPDFGTGKAGTIVDVVVVSDITDAAGSFIDFKDVKNVYFDTEITATVDKASGHITELYTKSPSIMSFGSVAVKPFGAPKIEGAQIGLTYENKYSIAY